MANTVSKTGTNVCFSISGTLKFSDAACTQETLLEAIAGATSLEVRDEGVTEVCIAHLQLILALAQLAEVENLTWNLSVPDSSVVLSSADRAGLGAQFTDLPLTLH